MFFYEHLKKYIETGHSEIVGLRVWYCLNKSQRLECAINEDGTISVSNILDKKFKTASDLLKEITDGSIDVGNFKIPRKDNLSKNVGFGTRLYFCMDGTKLVSSYVYETDSTVPFESSSTSAGKTRNICSGFRCSDQILLNIKCDSVKENSNRDGLCSRYCRGFKKATQSMCGDCCKARTTLKRVIKRVKSAGVDNKFQDTTKNRNGIGGVRSNGCKRLKKSHQTACTPRKKKKDA